MILIITMITKLIIIMMISIVEKNWQNKQFSGITKLKCIIPRRGSFNAP